MAGYKRNGIMETPMLNFLIVFAVMGMVWAIGWHIEWLMDNPLAAHLQRVYCFFKRAWRMAMRSPQAEARHQLLMAPFHLRRHY
jgi:hypothetical protein